MSEASFFAKGNKPVNGYGSPSFNYSTDEHIVGKWIDGKLLYEKTVNVGDMPNNASKVVSLGVSNLDMVIDYSGFIKHKTVAGVGFPLPAVMTGSTANVRLSLYDKNIQIISTSDMTSFEGYVTFRYTKTE